MNNTDLAASKHLGKKSVGSELYDPSLLVAVPRFENRKQYGINNEKLPFYGFDVWHAYEFSVMTKSGLPVTRLMKMRYSCESEFIVESKSLKLYLNSFNMSKFGDSIEECLEICKNTISNDLSKLLKTEVFISFFDNNSQRIKIFENYKNILDFIDLSNFKIDKFKEAPELLQSDEGKEKKRYFLSFDALRSNCRVTHQPDFGDIFISYESKKHIKEDNLVKYLCSFRSEYHFHEECCEMVYKRLYDLLDNDDKLSVCILYTRRGGIDIWPVRMSKNCEISDTLAIIDLFKYARNGIKQ